MAIKTNAALTPKQARRPQFIIAMDPDEFKKNEWRLDLLPAQAQTIVKELQPFESGMYAALPLIRLREWSNADKHRELRTLAWTGWGALAAYGIPPDIPVPALKDMHLGVLTPGTELFRFAFTEPHPEVDVNFRLRFSVAVDEPPDPRILGDRNATVAWQQRAPDALYDLLRLIDAIIPLFVPFV